MSKRKVLRRIRSTHSYENERHLPRGMARGFADRGEVWSAQIGTRQFIDEAELDALLCELGLTPGEFEIIPASPKTSRKAA